MDISQQHKPDALVALVDIYRTYVSGERLIPEREIDGAATLLADFIAALYGTGEEEARRFLRELVGEVDT